MENLINIINRLILLIYKTAFIFGYSEIFYVNAAHVFESDVSKISINLKKIYIGLSILLILILLITNIFYFQRTQSLQSEIDLEKMQLKNEINRLDSSVKKINRTLKLCKERKEKFHEINGNLRKSLYKPVVDVEYRSSSSANGSMKVNLNVKNYGNMTAVNITTSCNLYRNDENKLYDRFDVAINELPGKTFNVISTDLVISERLKNSDEISCEIKSCDGMCQPLHEKITTYKSNPIRDKLN